MRYCCTMVLLMVLAAPLLWAHEAQAAQLTPAEMKRLGVFLSNFTEVTLFHVEGAALTEPQTPEDWEQAIRFGIRHNYINNFKSRIKRCDNTCPYGTLKLDGTHVRESLQKYLGAAPQTLRSVQLDGYNLHYDGKFYHFEGADGEAVIFARVKQAHMDGDGLWQVQGELFNPDAPDELGHGSFTAVVATQQWQGKPAWKLVRLDCTLP